MRHADHWFAVSRETRERVAASPLGSPLRRWHQTTTSRQQGTGRLVLIANPGMRRRGSEAVTGPSFAESTAYPGRGREVVLGDTVTVDQDTRRNVVRPAEKGAHPGVPTAPWDGQAVLPYRRHVELLVEFHVKPRMKLPAREVVPSVSKPRIASRPEELARPGRHQRAAEPKVGRVDNAAARDDADGRGDRLERRSGDRVQVVVADAAAARCPTQPSSTRGRVPCNTGLAARAPRPSLEAAGDKLGDRCGALPIARSVCSADCPRARRTRTWSGGLLPGSWSQYAGRDGRPPHA